MVSWHSKLSRASLLDRTTCRSAISPGIKISSARASIFPESTMGGCSVAAPACAAQDVERECAAACASLAMPMPLNVSLRAEDLSQLQRHLLELLQQLEPPVPFTPSLKVLPAPSLGPKLLRPPFAGFQASPSPHCSLCIHPVLSTLSAGTEHSSHALLAYCLCGPSSTSCWSRVVSVSS